jgi:predicted RNase H-like HicB family nuclease
MKDVSLNQYVKEILKTAIYKQDSDLKCIVASVSILPGCMTQADNFEEARESLIDAIELWIMVGLRGEEGMPVINGIRLASMVERPEVPADFNESAYA